MTNISLAGEWTKKTEASGEIAQVSANVFNNEIYIFGGLHGGQNLVLKYNPTTDTLEEKANMPHKRQGCMSAEVNGKIYVFGTIQTD